MTLRRVATPSSVLVVAGNNCFAERRPADGSVISAFDRGMLLPFVLAWNGGSCRVLTTDTSSPRPRTSKLPASETRQVLSRPFASGMLRFVAMPLALARILRALDRSTTAYARLPSPMGACLTFAAMLMRRPLMCSLHGSPKWSRNERSWQSMLGLRWLYRMAARKAIRSAHLIFATDVGLADVYGLRADEIVEFSNTLLEEIPPLIEEFPTVGGGDLSLGFIGRLSPEKNPTFALDVVESLAQQGVSSHLAILGDGPMRPEILRRISGSNLTADCVGWVDDRGEVISRLRKLDFLLLPSLAEGSPKVMAEAMAMGTAVVTWKINSAVSALADEGRAAILRDSLDPDDWADAIVRSSNPLSYGDIIRNAHERVSGRTVRALVEMIRMRMKRQLPVEMVGDVQ